jgi:xylulokinase
MGAALGLSTHHGDVVVSLGTSGTVFTTHDRPVRDPSGELAGFADATGRQLPLMCTLNAARVLTAGAALLTTDLAGLDRLALEAPAGAGGLSLLPYLDGERTPDPPSATGTLSGLTRTNAAAENLAPAVVEGMLCNLASGVDSLRRLGIPVERILLIGGASASRAVRAIAPALFGVPVAVPSSGEYVGIGAARPPGCWPGKDSPLPEWPLSIDTVTEADRAATEAGSEVRQRYAGLLASMHNLA